MATGPPMSWVPVTGSVGRAPRFVQAGVPAVWMLLDSKTPLDPPTTSRLVLTLSRTSGTQGPPIELLDGGRLRLASFQVLPPSEDRRTAANAGGYWSWTW